MSKIRTVKPELFRHEQLFEAEQRSGFPLRLIFIGLFTVVDAEGRFRWRPRQLKLDVLPYDELDFGQALSALTECGLVKRYEHAGESYGYIPTWRKHQSINQREPNSVLPHPDAQTRSMLADVKLSDDLCSQNLVPSPRASVVTSEPPQKISAHAQTSDPSPEIPVIEPGTCTHMQDLSELMQDQVETISNPAPPVLASLEMEMEMEMEVEVEMEKEGKWKNTPQRSRTVPDPVEHVFEHWRCVMDHARAVLDKQRRRCIQLALDKGYSVEDLCQAITGCSLTPHNRGENDRGERYDGLHVILRSADQIDRFIRNAQSPPQALNKADQRLQGNVQAAQAWLQKQEEREEPHDSHG